jgi:signal transduction histidine kinase
MDSIDQARTGAREIEVTTQAVADGMQLSVSDTGIGLTPAVLERMFEPFFTTKHHGLGMGLSINKKIVAAHGGRMFATNRAEGGATVGFVLPCGETHILA